uniref:Uncharacterized protein n=1 Tax=Caenorhabditis japonica TaxID=281687 RepID=A0A8R1E9G2_CAEJA
MQSRSVTNTETLKAYPIETFTKYIILSLYSNFIVKKKASSQASRTIDNPKTAGQFEFGAETYTWTQNTRSCRRSIS